MTAFLLAAQDMSWPEAATVIAALVVGAIICWLMLR